MRTIEDFKKEFVTSVTFKSGDKIVITEDNIEQLRQILNKTNFRWRTGQHITDLSAPYDEPGGLIVWETTSPNPYSIFESFKI